jgi:hypothetical protein
LKHGFGDCYKVNEASAAAVAAASDAQAARRNGDAVGETNPIHWAAFKGHLHILCDLIEFYQGHGPNCPDDCGNTPLHLAASGAPTRGAHPIANKCVEVLLSAGADPHAKNRRGNTALQLCTNEACRRLLEQRQIADTTGGTGSDTLLSVAKLRGDAAALASVCDRVAATFDTANLDDLMAALEVAQTSFVHPRPIARGKTLLATLDAKRGLERAVEALGRRGACESLADGEDVRSSLAAARAAGVDAETCGAADKVMQRVLAEVKLSSVLAVCVRIERADASHELVKSKLERALGAATMLKASARLLKEAQLRITKMSAEILVKGCIDRPWKPSAADREGKAETEVAVMTLERRIERLRRAYDDGTADGVGADAGLVKEAKKLLSKMEADLEAARNEDQARILAEEEAAEAAKSKKKKKKKK